MGALRMLVGGVALVAATPAAARPVQSLTPFIGEASHRFGIPADWIERVIQAESGGRTMLGGRPITSPAGAMGPMQVMPATWRAVRRLLGLDNDPYDARDNILAGTFYLRWLYDRFGYPGLFAAYNAGPGRYADCLRTGRALPDETRAYLIKVAGSPTATIAIAAPRPSLFFGAGSSLALYPRMGVPAATGRAGDLFVTLPPRP